MNQAVQIGPFEAHEVVGSGGMGSVVRGEHRQTGVPVALKIISGPIGDGARRQFHKEVQAHAGLLHPSIVYLFEYGRIPEDAELPSGTELRAESPYVAMEWADGGSVRDVMPLSSWAAARNLIAQTLDALAHAHARGVVHRDLKPGNLLVFALPNGAEHTWQFKLADFGLAHAFAREHEADTNRLQSPAGTSMYMAPEQFRGRWRQYGPWTDLYALGCIAYELVCGHPPFTAEAFLALGLKHEREERPPLTPHFPVPDGLEQWIHRAMRSDPERRFRRAADALAQLPAGGARWRVERRETTPADEAASTEPTLPATQTRIPTLAPTEILAGRDGGEMTGPSSEQTAPSSVDDETDAPSSPSDSDAPPEPAPFPDSWQPHERPPIPTPLVGAGLGLFGLREPPFVDRSDECGRIWRALRGVVEAGGHEQIFIEGGPGTGKSRLAEWISTRAHEVGAVRLLTASHTPGGGPKQGLRGGLERALRTLKMERAEVHEHLLEQLPALPTGQPGLRERDARALTEYLRPATGGDESLDGPEYQFANEQHKRGVLVRLLHRLAEQRPLLVWLDDLQWGSEAIGVLEHLGSESVDAPELLVVATVRTDLVPEIPQVAARLDRLQAADLATTLALDPLSGTDQRALVEGLLPLDDTIVELLVERTEGHPLFALQMLEHWIDRGAIELDADGFRLGEEHDPELPEDIHSLWLERIDNLLNSFEQKHRADTRASLELAAALGREIDTTEWSTLLDRAELEPSPTLVDRLVERGLARRTPTGWAFAHGLFVESMTQIAREAGRWRRHNRRCARLLGERKLGREPGPRERLANHWIEAEAPEHALAPLLEEIRIWRDRDGDADCRRLLDRRLELLDDLGIPRDDPRRLAQRLERADLIAKGEDLEIALEILEEVWASLENAAEEDVLRHPAECARLLGRVHQQLGNKDRENEWLRRAVELSRRAGAEGLQSRCHRTLAWQNYFAGNLDRAEPHAKRAVRHAKRAIRDDEREDDRFKYLSALRTRAAILKARNDERARSLFERARREAENFGYVKVELEALNGLGELARFDDRLDDARKYYRRYLQKMHELSRPLERGTVLLNIAQVELRAGHFDEALETLRRAADRYASIGAESFENDLLQLVRLTHAAGLGDREAFDDRWQLLRDGWPEDWRLFRDHPWLLETAGEYAVEAGWPDRAKRLWRLARELWDELGDTDAAERVARRLEQR